MVLLDTCVLLWLAADQARLSIAAKKTLKGQAGELFVSAISAFEIAIKAKKGKLELPMEARIWFEKALRHHGVQEVPINGSIAIASVDLPPLHNDPCDRLIVATAVFHGMPVVTIDPLIAQYGEVKVIW